MAEQKRDHLHTFFVGHDLRTFPGANPSEFDPYLSVDNNAWGPHISFIPPVTVVDQNPDAAFNEIEAMFSHADPFYVYPVRDARFNLGRTPVTVIKGDTILHYALLGILLENKFGGSFPDEFTGKGHNGHVSLNGIPPIRTPIKIDAVSIFCKAMIGDSDEPVRYIHSRTVLEGAQSPVAQDQYEYTEPPF